MTAFDLLTSLARTDEFMSRAWDELSQLPLLVTKKAAKGELFPRLELTGSAAAIKDLSDQFTKAPGVAAFLIGCGVCVGVDQIRNELVTLLRGADPADRHAVENGFIVFDAEHESAKALVVQCAAHIFRNEACGAQPLAVLKCGEAELKALAAFLTGLAVSDPAPIEASILQSAISRVTDLALLVREASTLLSVDSTTEAIARAIGIEKH